jgi:hypothetical protein
VAAEEYELYGVGHELFGPPPPRKWPLPEQGGWVPGQFVWHYFTGGGKPVDLAHIGMLERFRAVPDVKRKVQEFKNRAEEQVKAIASSARDCPDYLGGFYPPFVHADTTTTRARNEIFCVGDSTFFRRCVCLIQVNSCCGSRIDKYEWSCCFHFYIRDWFRDLLDLGVELPGGQPYRINADWYENTPWQSERVHPRVHI